MWCSTLPTCRCGRGWQCRTLSGSGPDVTEQLQRPPRTFQWFQKELWLSDTKPSDQRRNPRWNLYQTALQHGWGIKTLKINIIIKVDGNRKFQFPTDSWQMWCCCWPGDLVNHRKIRSNWMLITMSFKTMKKAIIKKGGKKFFVLPAFHL